jgi:tRNA-uridine 2-sulfurtransferase
MSSVKKGRIVFGMDDRFPSRVAASILRNQGFDLLAVHLQFDLEAHGEDPSTYPTALHKRDVAPIEKFCESLGVPLKIIDVTEESLALVYNPYWIATLSGKRYAADAAWAKEILFPHLEAIAKQRGAESIATGHFARKSPELYRYSEPEFDQSRILARLDASTLSQLVLPVGEVSLDMLLRLAVEIGAISKSESGEKHDVSKLSEDRKLRGRWEWSHELLSNPAVQARSAGEYFSPGPMSGSVDFNVAEHRGIPFHQIGTPVKPGVYVGEIHPVTRAITVGPESNLSSSGVRVSGLTWCEKDLKDRHRTRALTVEREPGNALRPGIGPVSVPGHLLEYPGGLAEITFEASLFGLAPGETLVFYEESRVLGSALVVETLRGNVPEKAIENPPPAT